MKNIKLFFTCCFLFLLNSNIFSQWTVLNSGTTSWLKSVYFTNDSTGYVAGGNTILKTTDVGITWSSTAITINSTSLNAIHFPSASIGYAVGTNSAILKTTDAGTTWNLYNSGVTSGYQLVSVFFINNDTGYVGTMNAGSGNAIFKTIDGGSTWTNISAPFMNGANSICFPSNNVGYVVFADLFKTIDNGNNWSVYSVPEWMYTSVQFLDDTLGFAAGIGSNGSNNYGTIIKTIDGGITWSNTVFNSINKLFGIYFPSVNVGYSVGASQFTSSGAILKTNDGGNTWITQLDTELSSTPFAVYCPNDSLCFAVGDSGLILKTTNGGGLTGLSTIENLNSKVNIYPNPTQSNITIEFDLIEIKNALIEIKNILGQTIKTIDSKAFSKGKNKIEIDVSEFSKGLYFAQLQCENVILSKKFVKE